MGFLRNRMAPRTLWRVSGLSEQRQHKPFQDATSDWGYDGGSPQSSADAEERVMVASREEANIISSWMVNGLHAPALDIDLPCTLVPSRTEGHFHLFIDKPMEWEAYKKLLFALRDAGILEQNYVAASLAKHQTFLRITEGTPS